MKKIMSYLLSLSMAVSLSSTALAVSLESNHSENDDFGGKLYVSSYDCPAQYALFAKEKIHLFLEASEFSEFSPCYLGAPFTFSNSNSDVYYFPVYYSGEIICLLRVYSNEQGDIAGVLSKGFANELNAISDFTSATNPLNIYFDGVNIVFKTASIERTVFSYPYTEQIETAIINNDDLAKTVVECSVESASMVSLPQIDTRSSNSSHYLDIFDSDGYPAETQGYGENWCAAYSAAAIMRYKGMSGLYAQDIMEYFYGSELEESDMLSDSQIYTYATVQGFYTSKTNSTLSFVRLCNEIDYDRPVYIVVRREVGSEHGYHAIVLCGYNDTSGMVRIWNPWYDYYETIYSLSNYVPYEHQDRTYEYVRTIYNWSRGISK